MLLLGEGARIAGREAGALGSPHSIDPGTQWLPEAEYKLADRTPPPCPPPPDQQGQVTLEYCWKCCKNMKIDPL